MSRRRLGALSRVATAGEGGCCWGGSRRTRRTGTMTQVTDASLLSRLEQRLAEVRARASRAGRSRQALYELLAEILAVAAELRANPLAYANIRERAGIKAQSRAPFAPVLKLVFGEHYDRTRIAEYGTALSHAERRGLSPADFLDQLQTAPGGLKGVVQAERRLRQAASKPRETAGPNAERRPLRCPAWPDQGGRDGDMVLLLARVDGNQSPRFELLDIIEDSPERIRQIVQSTGRPRRQM